LRSAPVLALTLALVVGAVAGTAWLFTRGDSDSVRLLLAVPRKGAMVFRVQNSAGSNADNIGAFEFDSEFEGILTIKTRSVEGDQASVRGLLDVSTFIWNGRPETRRPTLRASFQLRSDGNFIGCRTFDPEVPAPTFDPIVTGLTPDLPPGEVRPGDSWTDAYSACTKKEIAQVSSRSQFLRYDEMNGLRVAVVQGTRTVTFSSLDKSDRLRATVFVDQTAWIDVERGTVVRMTALVDWNLTGRKVKAEGFERVELSQL
jgi:hypothetical protein